MEDFSESLSRPGTVNLSGCLRQIADHDLESSKHSPEPESPGALSKPPEQLCHIVLQYAVFQHSSTEVGNFVSDYYTQNISVYTFDSRVKFGKLSLICSTSTSLCLQPKCQRVRTCFGNFFLFFGGIFFFFGLWALCLLSFQLTWCGWVVFLWWCGGVFVVVFVW